MGAEVGREDLLLSKSCYEHSEPKRRSCHRRPKAVWPTGQDRRTLKSKRSEGYFHILSSPPSEHEHMVLVRHDTMPFHSKGDRPCARMYTTTS